MNWIAWIFLANAGIFWLEYVYRNGTYNSFMQALPFTLLPMILGQVGLFYGFRTAPNLLLAGAVFTVVNVSLRLVNSYRLGEYLNGYNWAGVVLLLIATILLKIK